VSCDFCRRELEPAHNHLLDPKARELRCACPGCASLFTALPLSRWKRVAHRLQLLSDFRLTDAGWASLGLPIDLAFFVRSTAAGRIVAFYPGPAGATESELALPAWTALAADNPVLTALAPDVEALLVNRTGPAREHYLVSVDECYRLVGLIRLRWRGLIGGTEAWAEIARFFDGLRERAAERVPAAESRGAA
jgi:Family of unknown function (DUF5947)